jgi:hypothetical protein
MLQARMLPLNAEVAFSMDKHKAVVQFDLN